MRFYREFVAMLLALFCIGTVHAASMGIHMQLAAVQDTAMTHCHNMSGGSHDEGGAGAGDSHVKPHHGSLCHSCAACVPMLLGPSAALPVSAAMPAQYPHREASYPAFVGKLPHRPPISA